MHTFEKQINKAMNKVNFWNKSRGVWTIIGESDNLNIAIETALNTTSLHDATFNFNECGDTLYIRKSDYCIRVSESWGVVKECNWSLDRDAQCEFIIAKIQYSDLVEIEDLEKTIQTLHNL